MCSPCMPDRQRGCATNSVAARNARPLPMRKRSAHRSATGTCTVYRCCRSRRCCQFDGDVEVDQVLVSYESGCRAQASTTPVRSWKTTPPRSVRPPPPAPPCRPTWPRRRRTATAGAADHPRDRRPARSGVPRQHGADVGRGPAVMRGCYDCSAPTADTSCAGCSPSAQVSRSPAWCWACWSTGSSACRWFSTSRRWSLAGDAGDRRLGGRRRPGRGEVWQHRAGRAHLARTARPGSARA